MHANSPPVKDHGRADRVGPSDRPCGLAGGRPGRRRTNAGVAGWLRAGRGSRIAAAAHVAAPPDPTRLERQIVALRRRGKLGPARIASIVGVPASTVHRVCCHRLNRLGLHRRRGSAHRQPQELSRLRLHPSSRRNRAPKDPTPATSDQRKGGAVQPRTSRRMGLCPGSTPQTTGAPGPYAGSISTTTGVTRLSEAGLPTN